MTFLDARDEIFAIFNVIWSPLGYPVVWANIPGEVPKVETVWASVSLTHLHGEHGSLGNIEGKRLWSRAGIFVVNVYSPLGETSSGYEAAQKLVAEFQKPNNSDIRFSNIHIQEKGCDGAFEQFLFILNFSYDDFS